MGERRGREGSGVGAVARGGEWLVELEVRGVVGVGARVVEVRAKGG